MIKKTLAFLTLLLGINTSAALAQSGLQTEDLTDYKTACYAAIENLGKIGTDNLTIRSMLAVTNSSISILNTKADIQRSMAFLRADVTYYLQVVKTFQQGQEFTGLVGNHSFDTGDLSLWYSLGFDLSKVKLSDITKAITGGDVSGLMSAVSLKGWNEETMALENTGDNAVTGGHKKYYLNCNQLVMQPIFGLPAGIYSLQTNVACKPGLLGLNKVHLSALVVSSKVVRDILGISVSTNKDWEDLLYNFNLFDYIDPILQNGKLYSESANCKSLTTFSDGELKFIVDEGDLVILGMDAGLVSFIGTEQFRADNLRLYGLWSAREYLAARNELSTALQGQTPIEANCNAGTDGTAQPAFSYDKTITENFNNALALANERYEDRLTDIISEDDMDNLDALDQIIRDHYRDDTQAFKDAKDAFYKQAFIAPAADEPFNILMRDDWTSLLTPKWTGNAITVEEDMSMRFSTKPGQSLFAQAFCFESASPVYTNRLRAFIDDNHDKYYLGERSGKLVLTTDIQEAVTITAVPSYTEEGEIHLMIGDMYLGTTSSNNTLVKTDSGTLLRATRTGLKVSPAAEMELTAAIPAGWNAATLMLPFDTELPEGVEAYILTGVNPTLPCIEKEPQTRLEANIPYYIKADAGSRTFSGVSRAVLPSYEEGLLTGRHTSCTTQGDDVYKLVNEDGFCFFSQMSGWPVAEHECYLKCAGAGSILCLDEEHATGIAVTPPSAAAEGAVYSLSGQKMNGRLPKGAYIRDGKKVIIR